MAFSLEAIFSVDAAGVRAGLLSARKELNDFASSWKALLGLIGGTAVLTGLAKGAIELAGRLFDASQNIGINVEALQALEAQHKRNGVSSDTLTKALEKLREGVQKAREGDQKAIEDFRRLGITWTDIANLPLEQKYAAVARGLRTAQDQASAYNAVSDLFGSKIGPSLMSSLSELAEKGFPKVSAEAQKAGQVMSAETIVALDRAGDAIDDFKKKITVAVGNVIVNFRTKEGVELLLLQFMKVVGQFGAGIVDAIYEGNALVGAVLKGGFKGVINYFRDGMIDAAEAVAKVINKILPAKYEINVGNLDQFRSSGKGIADEITTAIAQTEPLGFKKTVGDYWDDLIKKQQAVVDTINHVDLGKEAGKLKDAGKTIETSLAVGAQQIVEGGKAAAEEITRAANVLVGAITRTGKDYSAQSTAALEGLIDRLKLQASQYEHDPNYRSVFAQPGADQNPLYFVVKSELEAAQKELEDRRSAQRAVATYGEEGARRLYGDTIVDKGIRELQDATERNATASESIAANIRSISKKLGLPAA